jgi:DNA invertase Pin-like site-specific DNA recombinase
MSTVSAPVYDYLEHFDPEADREAFEEKWGRRELTPEGKRERARELYKLKASYAEIARELKITQSTVKCYVHPEYEEAERIRKREVARAHYRAKVAA